MSDSSGDEFINADENFEEYIENGENDQSQCPPNSIENAKLKSSEEFDEPIKLNLKGIMNHKKLKHKRAKNGANPTKTNKPKLHETERIKSGENSKIKCKLSDKDEEAKKTIQNGHKMCENVVTSKSKMKNNKNRENTDCKKHLEELGIKRISGIFSIRNRLI